MEEEFDFSSVMDDGMAARTAHAEFLNKVKDWAMDYAKTTSPFVHLFSVINQVDNVELDVDALVGAISVGIALMVQGLNSLYDTIQSEANDVLGNPFALHEHHQPWCDGTSTGCAHQDHYKKEGN